MRKVLLGIILWVSLLFSCHNNRVPVERINRELPINDVINATVAIIHERTQSVNESAQPYCSGFFISRTMIVSALHCFQEIRSINVGDTVIQIPTVPNPTGHIIQFARYGDLNMLTRHFENDVLNEARIVQIDSLNDIALLIIEPGTDPSDDYILLQTRAPQVTEHVYLVGHPQEIIWTVVDGIISRVLINERNRPLLIQATVPLIGGFSGGPLVNERGDVLGLTSGYMSGNHHISIFIASEQIAIVMLRYQLVTMP